MKEIDGVLKDRRRNLSEELITAILKLKPGKLLELGEEDFDGRTPEAFRLNVSNYMRAKKVHIKTNLVRGKLFIALRDHTEVEEIAPVVEQEKDDKEYNTNDAGELLDADGKVLYDFIALEKKNRELEEIRKTFQQQEELPPQSDPWDRGINIQQPQNSIEEENKNVAVPDWGDDKNIKYPKNMED